MSVTLATVADALIEFILSLLRDPEEVKKFDAAPQQVMAAKGLAAVTADDVCSVAPVIADRPDVGVNPAAAQLRPFSGEGDDPVVREVRNIVSNLYSIDDRDTIIDQSVNQNIWAMGDVTQTFDNEAIAATGDDSIAAGDDVGIALTDDSSTNITAGGDANVGNDTSTSTVGGSYNESTDASTQTASTTTTTTTDSLNDTSTTVTADESMNSSSAQYAETSVDVDANSAFDSSDTTIVDDSGADDDF